MSTLFPSFPVRCDVAHFAVPLRVRWGWKEFFFSPLLIKDAFAFASSCGYRMKFEQMLVHPFIRLMAKQVCRQITSLECTAISDCQSVLTTMFPGMADWEDAAHSVSSAISTCLLCCSCYDASHICSIWLEISVKLHVSVLQLKQIRGWHRHDPTIKSRIYTNL